MTDDRTQNLNLPLPHPSNLLNEDVMRIRQALTDIDGKALAKGDNLAGVADKAAARQNLGLGGAATKNVGSSGNDVAAGNHTHTLADIAGDGSMATQNADNVNITGGSVGGVDVTKLPEVITANLTITVGPGQTYVSPNDALSALAKKRIARGVAVYLQCTEGVHTYSGEWVDFQHPDSASIGILGAPPDYKNVLAQTVAAPTGSAGDWRVTLALDSVSGINIGDVVAIHRLTATSEFCGIIQGSWQVHAVNTAAKTITVRNTARRSSFLPAGQSIVLTGGRVTVFKTVVRPTVTNPGAAINCCTAAYVKDIAVLGRLAGTNTDDTAGIVTGGQGVHAASYAAETRYTNHRVQLENVVSVYFGSGLNIGQGRYLEAAGNNDAVLAFCGSMSVDGISIYMGGAMKWLDYSRFGANYPAGPQIIANGNSGRGLIVTERSVIGIYGSITNPGRMHCFCGNGGRGVDVDGAMALIDACRIEGNNSIGLGLTGSSLVRASDSQLLYNSSDGANVQNTSTLWMTGNRLARFKYNAYQGVYVANRGNATVYGITGGNGGAGYLVERSSLLRGLLNVIGRMGCVATATHPVDTDSTPRPGVTPVDIQFEFYQVLNSATAAAANANPSAGSWNRVAAEGVTLTLPATPANGDAVHVYSPSALCTVARNGKSINGAAADYVVQRTVSGSQVPALPEQRVVKFAYDSAAGNWTVSLFDWSIWAADTPYLPLFLDMSGTSKCVWPLTKYRVTGAGTFTLPANPSSGDTLTFTTEATTTAVLDRNGNTINGQASNYTLSAAYKTYTVTWTGATWVVS